MKIEDVLSQNIRKIPQRTVAGIDIGSRQAKGVLLYNQEIYTALIPTGFFMQENAEQLLEILVKQAGIVKEEIEYLVVTGYGRISLTFPFSKYRSVTEIACHGKGAYLLADHVKTIIDIGGQDSKAIRIDETQGNVIDFVMNDKCAAGSGRFLEKMANVLGYSITEMGEDSLKADKKIVINSTCVVFAESEVISARAKGESTSNLAAGIHASVARRVFGLLNKVGIESGILFTGGVSNNSGMRDAFEELLGVEMLRSKMDTVYAGALGAAAFAAEYAQNDVPSFVEREISCNRKIEFEDLKKAIDNHMQNFIRHSDGKKAYVGYLCSYIPLEILSAANVSYIRLMNKGSADEITAGEAHTQSMQCDFHKGLLGGFHQKRPEYMALDRIYSFHVCSCMRKSLEAISSKYIRVDIFNLPKNRHQKDSVSYLAKEMKGFKKNLEELTGQTILEEDIAKRAEEYRYARELVNKISAFRKKFPSMIESETFQYVIQAYYSLPIDVLISELEEILLQLSQKEYQDEKRLKLMISGGMIATGDDKVIKILRELGADVVIEDNCTGIKPLNANKHEQNKDDIYENLSTTYLEKTPCASMFDIEEMLDHTVNLAKEYEVDGIIFYYLKFCSCFSLLEKEYEQRMKKENIPLYIVSGDYAAGDEGQLKTRLEAFIEMLQVKKDIRLIGGN